MKLWIWGGAVVVVMVLFAPFQGKTLARLEPAEVLYVTADKQSVSIETDTGSQGSGRTLQEAMNDMNKTASAEVFLDTADYLILSAEALSFLDELGQYLRPGCRVCAAFTDVDPKEAAVYLAAHQPGRTLGEEKNIPIPVLIVQEGRMQLVQ